MLNYFQKEYIKEALSYPLHLFTETRKTKIKYNPEMLRENGELKNFIGVDLNFKRGKDRHVSIELYWGTYDKIESEEDIFKLLENIKHSKTLKISTGFNKDSFIEETINKVYKVFDESLKEFHYPKNLNKKKISG